MHTHCCLWSCLRDLHGNTTKPTRHPWGVHLTGTCCFSGYQRCRAPGLESAAAVTAHVRSSDREGLPLMHSSGETRKQWRPEAAWKSLLSSPGLTRGWRQEQEYMGARTDAPKSSAIFVSLTLAHRLNPGHQHTAASYRVYKSTMEYFMTWV